MPTDAMRRLRYASLYPAYSQARVNEEEAFAARLRALGWDIITLPMPERFGHMFPDLDVAWRTRDPHLMAAYDEVRQKLDGRDVLLMMGGHMAHPDFLESLPHYKIFICADDPESSAILSKPVAPFCNYSIVLNVAELDTYRSWGCKNVAGLYSVMRPDLYDPRITEESILTGERPHDISIFTEYGASISKRYLRIEALMRAFPQAILRGSGWPGGRMPQGEMLDVMSKSKIGWNIHHSTGPINIRFMLVPANGMMQICDNKDRLSPLFELGKEIIGFDTIEECIDLTRYYLAHDDERRQIAAAGWKRTMRDYTEDKWWETIIDTVTTDFVQFRADRGKPLTDL